MKHDYKYTMFINDQASYKVHYNTVLDTTQLSGEPQSAISDKFSYIIYTFYSHYNTVWITNTEIALNPNNSVIKRLCTD